ncbi:MAG: (deoxy)nucleoside triphosphate pyrophosphohydrolase [Clostridia bacterium]|nr:(deoxy)nucleoside triphosphate pyrophosphohydrolase [Clostridia bacterium]
MTEVVAAIIWHEGRYLICQRPAHKARGLLWEFPGGKVEPGETREEAIIRECREELDTTLEPLDVFTEVTHQYPDLCIHLSFLRCRVQSGQPRALEHAAIRWIRPEEASAYDFCPADLSIVQALAREAENS